MQFREEKRGAGPPEVHYRLARLQVDYHLARPGVGYHLARPGVGYHLARPEVGYHLARLEVGYHLARLEAGYHVVRLEGGDQLAVLVHGITIEGHEQKSAGAADSSQGIPPEEHRIPGLPKKIKAAAPKAPPIFLENDA
jgi:hypothetical protein